MLEPCAVCGTPAEVGDIAGINKTFDCARCGFWIVIPAGGQGPPVTINVAGGQGPPVTINEILGDWDARSVHRRSRLSHILRQQQTSAAKAGQMVGLPLGRVREWRLDDALPTPAEQLDRLVTWIGEHQPTFAERVALSTASVAAWIGAPITRNHPDSMIGWLLNTEEGRRLIEFPGAAGTTRLTLAGWQRFEELRNTNSQSRIPFMAFQFDDADVQFFVAEVVKPAVEMAGFELRTLAEPQAAGLIDDHLRVALRTARFVISDLTSGNKGAYWEAGFAEGLGRPVIYSCRKAEWENKDTKPHFDTNHLNTIIWTHDDPGTARENLKATIRATLPAESKLTD